LQKYIENFSAKLHQNFAICDNMKA